VSLDGYLRRERIDTPIRSQRTRLRDPYEPAVAAPPGHRLRAPEAETHRYTRRILTALISHGMSRSAAKSATGRGVSRAARLHKKGEVVQSMSHDVGRFGCRGEAATLPALPASCGVAPSNDRVLVPTSRVRSVQRQGSHPVRSDSRMGTVLDRTRHGSRAGGPCGRPDANRNSAGASRKAARPGSGDRPSHRTGPRCYLI
jgi:hypothetical protein